MVQKDFVDNANGNSSPLQKLRLQFSPTLPTLLHDLSFLQVMTQKGSASNPELEAIFPKTAKLPFVGFQRSDKKQEVHAPLNVAVVLSGGQAPGGHNVIAGLFDALKKLHGDSRLFGFLNGPKGIITQQSIEITEELLLPYRNQGGFDLIGSGRDKIETPEQFLAAEVAVRKLNLQGLVIIGGDDSNTNAAFLAEHFLQKGIDCCVIGVPKTIDGDLKNEYIELPFGFDTACKTYSEIIGNMARDALSAKKYYYFIKIMGRSASHVALECALQTHPNVVLLGEEAEAEKKTLTQLTHEICDVICQRSEQGKQYGVVLITEGIIEFIPEVKQLISELNALLGSQPDLLKKLEGIASPRNKVEYIERYLTPEAKACFGVLPADIQLQLMLERDPHGNVQVSKIETERFFIKLVQIELEERKRRGVYKGSFSPQPHFCGYEGRSCMPSNFDSQYGYALGYVAALLIAHGLTGYMSCVRNLTNPVEHWEIAGVPFVPMMNFETRKGKKKAVIQKALVDLKGRAYRLLQKERSLWALHDSYRYPGPIQFFGPKELTESFPITLGASAEKG